MVHDLTGLDYIMSNIKDILGISFGNIMGDCFAFFHGENAKKYNAYEDQAASCIPISKVLP